MTATRYKTRKIKASAPAKVEPRLHKVSGNLRLTDSNELIIEDVIIFGPGQIKSVDVKTGEEIVETFTRERIVDNGIAQLVKGQKILNGHSDDDKGDGVVLDTWNDKEGRVRGDVRVWNKQLIGEIINMEKPDLSISMSVVPADNGTKERFAVHHVSFVKEGAYEFAEVPYDREEKNQMSVTHTQEAVKPIEPVEAVAQEQSAQVQVPQVDQANARAVAASQGDDDGKTNLLEMLKNKDKEIAALKKREVDYEHEKQQRHIEELTELAKKGGKKFELSSEATSYDKKEAELNVFLANQIAEHGFSVMENSTPAETYKYLVAHKLINASVETPTKPVGLDNLRAGIESEKKEGVLFAEGSDYTWTHAQQPQIEKMKNNKQIFISGGIE